MLFVSMRNQNGLSKFTKLGYTWWWKWTTVNEHMEAITSTKVEGAKKFRESFGCEATLEKRSLGKKDIWISIQKKMKKTPTFEYPVFITSFSCDGENIKAIRSDESWNSLTAIFTAKFSIFIRINYENIKWHFDTFEFW